MRKKKVSLSEICIILLMLFLSWGNFQIFGLYFFIILQTIFCFISMIKSHGKVYFDKKDKVILMMLILSLISAVFAFLSSISDSYKKYSLVMTIVLIPSYLSYSYLKKDFQNNNKTFQLCLKYIKIGFLIQIIIIPIQLVLYKAGIDINNLVFNELFNMMENPTFFRQGTYYPSGFTWHSAVLAPLLVLSYLMFEKQVWVKVLILIDAFICGNNTALIGVALTVLFVCLRKIIPLLTSKKIKTKNIILLFFVFIFITVLFICYSNIINIIIEKLNYVWMRIYAGSDDSSSKAHFSYYLLYPKVLATNTFLANIFGTGYASSGYSITQISGQYEGLKHWAVESDFIDILISKGILGFIVYYFFLAQIALKGKKIDYRYTVAILVIVLQGITYNVQFEYVFFIELLMYACISLKLDFFS